jgi:VWFA-related protein
MALPLVILLLGAASSGVVAQELVDTIRVDTRVVFLDALVKEKRSGIPISDLTPENFEVFDNGQPRKITYFTRAGQARKPLALAIILDCRKDGAGRFLKRPEVIKSIADEIAKLPPGDEIGIMAMNIGEDEKRVWLTTFTNDRQRLAQALARVPGFVENDEPSTANLQAPTSEKNQSEPVGTSNNAAQVEIIKGKNGAVVTRVTKADGSVDLKRTSGGGNVTVELEDVYDMAAAVRDATRSAQKERPNSQAAIVWVSDGIAPIFFEDRDATEQILIRSNVIFNSLTVDLRTLFKFLLPIGKPIAGWAGISLYGSAKRLAQQSGGEAVRVNRVRDYGTGLSRIFGNLTARYSLGFALAENEIEDGTLHNLELRVRAEDAKGKKRKIEVSSRRGYYNISTKETTARTQ